MQKNKVILKQMKSEERLFNLNLVFNWYLQILIHLISIEI